MRGGVFQFAVAVLVAVQVCLRAQNRGIEGSATKIGKANPTVSIVGYSGPAEIRQRLEAVLKRSDWLEVLPQAEAGKASVQMNVKVEKGSAGMAISAQVRAGRHDFSLAVTDDKDTMAVLKLVDALLKKVFNVPALCTRKILFAVQGANARKELFACYLDGSDYKRVTNNNAICTEPSWGHAGAFVYTLLHNSSIRVILVDYFKNRQRVVSSFKGLNSSAALSRDGRYLALPLSLDNKVDLYVIDLSNGTKTRLTNDKHVESSPCWSPDGKRLCYVSDAVGKPQLYIIAAEGGKPQRLQLGGNECVSPDWSPVSNRICYTTRSNAGQYIVNVLDMASSASSTTPVTVTNAAGDWEAPSWAPDGRHLVCTRASGKSKDLFMIDTALKNFSQITKGVNVSLPAWQPAF